MDVTFYLLSLLNWFTWLVHDKDADAFFHSNNRNRNRAGMPFWWLLYLQIYLTGFSMNNKHRIVYFNLDSEMRTVPQNWKIGSQIMIPTVMVCYWRRLHDDEDSVELQKIFQAELNDFARDLFFSKDKKKTTDKANYQFIVVIWSSDLPTKCRTKHARCKNYRQILMANFIKHFGLF